jgi:hypothetical protein
LNLLRDNFIEQLVEPKKSWTAWTENRPIVKNFGQNLVSCRVPAPSVNQIQVPRGVVLVGLEYPLDKNYTLNPRQQLHIYGKVLYYSEEMNITYRGQPYPFALAMQQDGQAIQR